MVTLIIALEYSPTFQSSVVILITMFSPRTRAVGISAIPESRAAADDFAT